MTFRLLLAASVLAGSVFAATATGERGQEIPLWPHGAPGSEGQTSPEVVQGPDNVKNFKRISNINNP
ncbi:MAG: hypothetical protein M3Y57_19945 [Acidobacteriota bacterium]|nr:hypothetical protein [Acidobacteriota bacterium]